MYIAWLLLMTRTYYWEFCHYLIFYLFFLHRQNENIFLSQSFLFWYQQRARACVYMGVLQPRYQSRVTRVLEPGYEGISALAASSSWEPVLSTSELRPPLFFFFFCCKLKKSHQGGLRQKKNTPDSDVMNRGGKSESGVFFIFCRRHP